MPRGRLCDANRIADGQDVTLTRLPSPAPHLVSPRSGKGLVVRGRHWLSIAPTAAAPQIYRARFQNGLLGTGLVALAPLASGVTPASWVAAHKSSATPLGTGPTGLPANVHLVTLQSLSPTSTLVRLAHLYEAGEDATMSAPATVSLASLFAGKAVSTCTEMTLIDSIPLADVAPVSYLIDGRAAPVTLPVVPPAPAGASLDVTLAAMEIRTFECAHN